MVQSNFTHQEVHEISSKGVSGAEVLRILVDRAFICLPDHDWCYPTLICFLKKAGALARLSVFMCHTNDCSVYYPSLLKKTYLLLYVCVHAEWGRCYKVCEGQVTNLWSQLSLFCITWVIGIELWVV